MIEKRFRITAPSGLHARPATSLIHAVTPYKSNVELEYQGKSVNLKSILGVMALGIKAGTSVSIKATGDDAHLVLTAVEEVIAKEGLGEICP